MFGSDIISPLGSVIISPYVSSEHPNPVGSGNILPEPVGSGNISLDLVGSGITPPYVSGRIRHHFAVFGWIRQHFAVSGQIRQHCPRSSWASMASRSGDLQGSETGYNTGPPHRIKFFFDKKDLFSKIFADYSLNWPN
jgi:hypothetical protein